VVWEDGGGDPASYPISSFPVLAGLKKRRRSLKETKHK